jgi:hypothetical protein
MFVDRLRTFLRRIHPSKTAANVAADTGCSADQVEKWLVSTALPNCLATMRLVAAYGPEFLAAMFGTAPAWLDAACAADRAKKIDLEIARREQELADLRAQLQAR